MLPLKAKYKDKEIEFEIPLSWSEVTLGQFIKLAKWDKQNYLELLAIITGLDKDIIYNCDAASFEQGVIKNIDWIKETPQIKTILIPKQITIDGREFDVPTDLTLKTFGQKLSIQIFLEQAAKSEMTIADCIPFVLAVYFQPEYEGRDYDEDRAKLLIPLMEKCKVFEAYPVGNFFLSKLINSLSMKVENSQANIRLMKLRQEWKNLMRLVGSLPLMRWRKATF